MRVRPFASLALVSLVGLAALPAWAAGSCERLVASGDPERPPYLWRDPKQPGQLVGAAADLAAEIGKQLDIKIEILDSGSASQALDDVQSGRVDLLLGGDLTLAQLESMDYVHPPMLELPLVVWLRKDAGFSYLGWNDLRGRNGVRLAGSDGGAQFENFARANLILNTVEKPRQAFERLRQGKADYLLIERHAGAAAAADLGLAEALQAAEAPVHFQSRYLALSHNSACNEPWLRGQLARKMTELSASGLPSRLVESNLQRWQAEQAGKARTLQENAP